MDIFTITKNHLSGCRAADIKHLSEQSGVPFHTLMKIKTGETKNPGVLTVQAVINVINPAASSKKRKSN